MLAGIVISFVYKHVWTTFSVRHSLHLTSQHQWKVQLHRSTTNMVSVRYPRPQHMRSQPSTPILVSLQARPCVPGMPSLGFFSQKPGDDSKYTRSFTPGVLWSGLCGRSWNLYRSRRGTLCGAASFRWRGASNSVLGIMTRDAPSKPSFNASPTDRKLGSRIQHVLTVQDPDIPWHLHSWRISVCTCCGQNEPINNRQRDTARALNLFNRVRRSIMMSKYL